MKSEKRILGNYSYSDDRRDCDEVSGKSIELIHFSLSEDTCFFELTSKPLSRYDEDRNRAQWNAIIDRFWLPSKELVEGITNWPGTQIIPGRFRVLEGKGDHCKSHFHGFPLENTPWDNLQIYVHTYWLDSLRRLEYDFVDLSFIVEEGRDLENRQLLPRREELMEGLSRFKSEFEKYLTTVVRLILEDGTLVVLLQPIECEADYDHECYSWSFMMKGIVT